MSKCINCKKFLSCKHTDTEQKCAEYEYRSEVNEMIKEIDKKDKEE